MTFLRNVSGSALIITHEGPDPDAIAASIAVKRFLQKQGCNVTICLRGKPNEQARLILKACGESFVPEFTQKVDNLIVVDMNSWPEIEKFFDLAPKHALIDHHAAKLDVNARFEVLHVDESSTSAAEIVYELLKEEKFKLDKNASLAICAGIVYDTAGFLSAKPATFAHLAEILADHKLNYSDVLKTINIPLDYSEKLARIKAAQRARVEKVGDFVILITKVSAFEGAVAGSLLGLGADLVLVANDEEGRIAAKCKKSVVEAGVHLGRDVMPAVGKILKGEGGGHAPAAGAQGEPELVEKGLAEALVLIRKALKD